MASRAEVRPGSAENAASKAAPPASCPRCGEPAAAVPAVPAASLGGLLVRRCLRCGTRSAQGHAVFSCESCGLPFAADPLLPRSDHRCEDCRDGHVPADLPDPALASATEAEVLGALGDLWRFVASERTSAYLDRIARHVATRVEGAPRVHVRITDDARLRTLALPSGTLLVSRGTVAGLEDEAELAFVLGHEVAHAASGDAAVRLVRLGFHAVAHGRERASRASWGEAVLDLLRLGYGKGRERDADARAFEAVLALGYDPASVFRYLGRLHDRIAAGDAEVADLAASHPPPRNRMQHLERAYYGRVQSTRPPQVNREVFRRAAGAEALRGLMAERGPGAGFSRSGAETGALAPRRGRRWLLWGAAAAAVLAALLVLALL